MANKNRILFLLKYLQEHSDERDELSTAELRRALTENGYSTSVPTLRNDIDTLINAGFDITINEKPGAPTTYCYIDREWSTPELQILIDAVSSSQFLTREKSRDLIRQLADMACPSDKEELKPSILVSENTKAKSNMIFLNVQAIRKGIGTNKKVGFKYFNYNLDIEKEYRHGGEEYILSPYATVWKDDRYYVVGYSDKREKIVQFRVDRIDTVTVTEDDRVPQPEEFNIRDYTEKVFNMFDGEEAEVTIRCKHELIDQVIDKFGEGIQPKNITGSTFDFSVTVCLSETFFAWVFTYAGGMTIVGPEKASEWYINMLQNALDDALGV